MGEIVSKVSKFAVKIIAKQLNDHDHEGECSGMFEKSFGLPCMHTLKELIESGRPITMDMIHPQWHLHWHAQVPEADEEHVSPTSKIIKKLKVSIEGLHGSQLQPFLS